MQATVVKEKEIILRTRTKLVELKCAALAV